VNLAVLGGWGIGFASMPLRSVRVNGMIFRALGCLKLIAASVGCERVVLFSDQLGDDSPEIG
jgi:hypothetical protein